ncbi:MAG: GHMP kinase [Candidatus Liberibacter europaeus]|uniref:GHMP kinase n=1 Tax=Candidatus Liberibacter europaeus TaxID=744859 RepID=A0A2T4VW89_9HYPH|nr:GHMP kinase [Candidatus Liberibacter europaeus]PTL86051.1 MAG: GHMP kinase [Candidatus Liberibacter europaeus]
MGQCLRVINVNAPGSLVLMGEHGVLHGHAALVFALNKGISIFLKLRKDRIIYINSSLGSYTGCLDLPIYHPSFSFVIAAINHLKPHCGFDLEINSQIDHQSGLGSSSAITVAMTAALLFIKYSKKPLEKDILRTAHEIVLKVQGISSGIDLAASIYGGLILYSMPNYRIKNIPTILPIHIVYSGYKMPTSQVLDKILHVENEYPSIKVIHQEIYSIMGQLSNMSAQAICDGNLKVLAKNMNMQQGLLETLGVSDQKLSDIVWKLRKQSGIMAAKISGSGLGDCVIALGKADPNDLQSYNSIDCTMHIKGIQISFE